MTRVALFEGADWQVLGTQSDGRAIVVHDTLMQRWIASNLIEEGTFDRFSSGERQLLSLSSGPSQVLCPVSESVSPDSKAEALAFALALKATREIDADSGLQDALYVEKITRLLPTYSISSRTDDDVVLGYWLTGGTSIPASAFRRLQQNMSWLGAKHLKDVVQAAGVDVSDVIALERRTEAPVETVDAVEAEEQVCSARRTAPEPRKVFALAGRPELAAFFNEHIVDIVLNRERYKALGIDFPSAVILHGPPGCGKTFAVERLVDFLGWPSFQIDASSVASPYIHETSKKVAQVFEKAMDSAPSVLVIDEMEAFLADRESGTGSSHHRVEEVAEFLRRIPEAVKNEVLIVAMTNRIEMIDPAIQRRGRFDHVVKVDFASEIEVKSLLDKLLSSLPKEADVDSVPLAGELAGRPLSDVAFVVREGARLAARAGKDQLDQVSLLAALNTTPAREREGGGVSRRIGFI
jgi:ATP-dependent 26S proteasome regulatory subunit